MKNGQKTQNIIGDKSLPCQDALVSHYLNGPFCLKEEHLILKRSYRDTTQLSLTQSKCNLLERDLRSSCLNLPPLTKSKLTKIGALPQISGLTHLPSICPGRNQNCADTSTISHPSLSMSTTHFTPTSSTLIQPVDSRSKGKNSSALIQSKNPDGLKFPIFHLSEWLPTLNCNSSHLPPTQEIRERVGVGEVERNHYDRNLLLKGKPVTTGTEELARNPQLSAYAIMSAAVSNDKWFGEIEEKH